jgi:class 3 adenylate cyclase
METRIGVHLGDVIVQDYRVYGDGVNIAARLQTVAAPGSICVSEAVYQQVYTKLTSCSRTSACGSSRTSSTRFVSIA